VHVFAASCALAHFSLRMAISFTAPECAET
jgi:hypothetical protein